MNFYLAEIENPDAEEVDGVYGEDESMNSRKHQLRRCTCMLFNSFNFCSIYNSKNRNAGISYSTKSSSWNKREHSEVGEILN